MTRPIWLTGAAGVGKTFHGRRAAALLNVRFVELDGFREAAWRAISSKSLLSGTRFERCQDYVTARTLSLARLEEFMFLHRVVGAEMVAQLHHQLSGPDDDRTTLIESSAIYLCALPTHGIRLRLQVARRVHESNLRRLTGVSAQEAATLCSFLLAVEERSLAASYVDVHVSIGDLLRQLRQVTQNVHSHRRSSKVWKVSSC